MTLSLPVSIAFSLSSSPSLSSSLHLSPLSLTHFHLSTCFLSCSPSVCLFFSQVGGSWYTVTVLNFYQVSERSSFPPSNSWPVSLFLHLSLSSPFMSLWLWGRGGGLDVAPLPDCSPFTGHVSLQGLSLPPVCLSISAFVWCYKVNMDRAYRDVACSWRVKLCISLIGSSEESFMQVGLMW